MRTTGVICRFLSLLDVTLILLGMMMIVMAQAQLSADHASKPTPEGTLPAVETLYVFAGTYGAESGKCFALGSDARPDPLRPLRTDTPDDLRTLFGTVGGPKIVVLLVSGKGFDAMWDARRLAAIEAVWRVKVVPVYDFQTPTEKR